MKVVLYFGGSLSFVLIQTDRKYIISAFLVDNHSEITRIVRVAGSKDLNVERYPRSYF